MKMRIHSRFLVFLLMGVLLEPSVGCVKRPGAVSSAEGDGASGPGSGTSESYSSSPILKKEAPPASSELGSPLNSPTESPSQERLNSINDYLYNNASAKTKKLTGFQKAMYDTWGVVKYVIAGAALVGYIETQHPKK